MKQLSIIFIICLCFAACEKEDSSITIQDQSVKRELDKSEIILKNNLSKTAIIVAKLANEKDVFQELTNLSSIESKREIVTFRELLSEPNKSTDDSFKNLRVKLKKELLAKGTSNENLLQYLVDNNCYLYCPYPENFYQDGIKNFTVASHPIDNDAEGVGYIFNGSKAINEVTVNEEYTDHNPVLLIMPEDRDDDLINPIIEDPVNSGTQDTIYEVKIGHIRCADYCGGIFEGTLELRVARGFPEFNSSTEVVTGKFSTVYPIAYPRKYAKAAIKNWSSYEGGWYKVNALWDSNWKDEKVQQGIIVYEYDRKKEIKVGATVGYKSDSTSINGTLETEAKIESYWSLIVKIFISEETQHETFRQS